ncbi:hypothetical protein Tco_0137687 [Tanacetum coccineum]
MSATQTSSQKALTPSLDHFNVVTRICDAVSTHCMPNLDHLCLELQSCPVSCQIESKSRVVNGHLLKLGGSKTNCTSCESALENMHYSQMIRFDNAKEASASSHVHLEACSSSHKSRNSLSTPAEQVFMCLTIPFAVNSLKRDGSGSASICHKKGPSGLIFCACDDESCKHIIFKVEDDFVHIEPRSCKFGGKLNMEHLKVEVACLYFLILYKGNRSRGWIVKRLMKLYVDCCNDLFQPPNLILLKKLYKLQVSKDEIDVVDCGLEDVYEVQVGLKWVRVKTSNFAC